MDTLAVLCDKPHKSFKSRYVFKKKKRRPRTVSSETTRMRNLLAGRRRRVMQLLGARMHDSDMRPSMIPTNEHAPERAPEHAPEHEAADLPMMLYTRHISG